MSKLSTLQLVRDLTLLTPDEGTIERYYNESVKELHQFFPEISLIPIEQDQSTFELPDTGNTLLQVFYDARMLDLSTLHDYRTVGIQWRDKKGEPLVYIEEQEGERRWRIAPTPQLPSRPPLGFGFLGVNYPSYNILALYTTSPDETLDIFDLLIAHRILSREFSRESSHQDIQYAERCQIIYTLLLTALNI